MKHILIVLILQSLLAFNGFSQVPEAFQYQSVIRDLTNAVVSNQLIGLQISIQHENIGGLTVYSEAFMQSTSSSGVINVTIGSGTVLSGDFPSIDWTNGPFYLEVSCDLGGGTNYMVMNTTPLMSVPYALHSKTAQTVLNDAVIDADSDPTNELQTMSRSGLTVNLSHGGGNYEDSVTIYSEGAGITINNNVISAIEPTYTIGHWPELGGHVFWLSPDGKHGLVVEDGILKSVASDGLGFDSWVMNWAVIANANMNPINHTPEGQRFSDWRLPTKYELNEIYVQLQSIYLAHGSYFWCSTEIDEDLAWVQGFDDGFLHDAQKIIDNAVNVITVRSF